LELAFLVAEELTKRREAVAQAASA
jgi:hypothetical protein